MFACLLRPAFYGGVGGNGRRSIFRHEIGWEIETVSVWWFMVVRGGSWCFVVVRGGSRWFVVVRGCPLSVVGCEKLVDGGEPLDALFLFMI